MIKFIFIPLVIMLSCGSTKTNQSVSTADSVVVSNTKSATEKDSLAEKLAGKTRSEERRVGKECCR